MRMKKKVVALCICFSLFWILSLSIGLVYATDNERIEFIYNGRVFSYELADNIKSSERFDLNFEINKYKRFSNYEDRKNLLNHMLNVGFDKDVALEYMFPNLNELISSIQKNIQVLPKDAKMQVDSNTNKVFFISPEVVGIDVDRNKLFDLIAKKYLNNEELSINVPIKFTYPTIRAEYYEKYTHLRADFSTDISRSSADRKHNVKTALNALNKVEILPNSTFSFNKTTGRRTPENGYRTAKIIVNNEYVDGVGGGVCQVSTTLYNSALLAGLDIKEANKHSKQVSYVRYGFDAMVNYGSSDLKIYNNTNERVTIITNYSSTRARIRIFGEDMGDTQYKLTNEISDVVEPIDEIEYDESGKYIDKVQYDDEYFYLKTGNRGMQIKSYRDKYVKGKLISHELLRTDKYKAQNAIKVYGTKKRAENSALNNEILNFLEWVA